MRGDPRRLVTGLDDSNQLCGQPGTELESRPFLYFACLQYGRSRPTLCVSQCPALSGHYMRTYNGSTIHCDAHGRMIPATTYPTTHLNFACVPSGETLYGMVSSIIDENAFNATIQGIILAWPFLLVACTVASFGADLQRLRCCCCCCCCYNACPQRT